MRCQVLGLWCLIEQFFCMSKLELLVSGLTAYRTLRITTTLLLQTDQLAHDMSQSPEDALKGIEVKIAGSHTFIVEDQSTVIASGKTIMIFPPHETKATWAGQNTGSDGESVSRGMKVFVNDVTVVFS